jgi:tetratricopeptide (TPR) repeat protein
MSISLQEAIGQAQTAFDSGDYRSVVESCSRIIDQYPHFTSAQRLLGQAYLQQGQPGEAESWFARLLAHDPREASAYLGLGLIAEDRGVLDHALAYCQVAWELAPEQAQYRDTMTRVAERRYGSDGRLRLTHAALACAARSRNTSRRSSPCPTASISGWGSPRCSGCSVRIPTPPRSPANFSRNTPS